MTSTIQSKKPIDLQQIVDDCMRKQKAQVEREIASGQRFGIVLLTEDGRQAWIGVREYKDKTGGEIIQWFAYDHSMTDQCPEHCRMILSHAINWHFELQRHWPDKQWFIQPAKVPIKPKRVDATSSDSATV